MRIRRESCSALVCILLGLLFQLNWEREHFVVRDSNGALTAEGYKVGWPFVYRQVVRTVRGPDDGRESQVLESWRLLWNTLTVGSCYAFIWIVVAAVVDSWPRFSLKSALWIVVGIAVLCSVLRHFGRVPYLLKCALVGSAIGMTIQLLMFVVWRVIFKKGPHAGSKVE